MADIQVTDEMLDVFALARAKSGGFSDCPPRTFPWDAAGLAAVLAIVERDLRTQIAYRIRAELVCCDIYEQDHDTDRAGERHPICFWGEAGARIAEGRS